MDSRLLNLPIVLLIISCNLSKTTDSIDSAAQELSLQIDEAVDILGQQSSDWQTVLENLNRQIHGDLRQTVRVEIQNLVSNTIGQIGVEFRCDADFLKTRVAQGLIHIKNHLRQILTGVEIPKLTMPPSVCSTVPLAVDMDLNLTERRLLTYYGYDLAKETLDVYAHVRQQNQITEIDLQNKLNFPSRYIMTVDLEDVRSSWEDIVIKFAGEQISSVRILKETPELCTTVVLRKTPNEETYTPPKKGDGDRDFGGNGPKINCSVQLLKYTNRIDAKITMEAEETKSDWTKAEGTKVITLVTAPPGKEIVDIQGITYSNRSYTDSDHKTDVFQSASEGPVRVFKFVGDTDGDEAGLKTEVTLSFNEIRYTVRDVGTNCITITMAQLDLMSRERTISLRNERLLREKIKAIQRQ